MLTNYLQFMHDNLNFSFVHLNTLRTEKVIYVDKDRAAAVIIGESKDLKSAMRGKRRRDRSAADANVSKLLLLLYTFK